MAASPACPAAVSRLTGRPIDTTPFTVGTGTQVDPSVQGAVFTDPGTGLRSRILKNSWEGWGGTLGLDWKPDTDTLVYAKYSRGYKTGGFNATDRDRHALTFNVCRSWMKQRFDYPRLMPREMIDSMDEVGRRFIGWDVRVPTSLEEYYVPPDQRLYKAGQG